MKERLYRFSLVSALFFVVCAFQVPYCYPVSNGENGGSNGGSKGMIGGWLCSFCGRANPKENEYCKYCAHWKD